MAHCPQSKTSGADVGCTGKAGRKASAVLKESIWKALFQFQYQAVEEIKG
jgi:hypothetical protein